MLFPYQRRALAWMTWREERGHSGAGPRDRSRVRSARKRNNGGATSSDAAGPSDEGVMGPPVGTAVDEDVGASPGSSAVQLQWCWRPAVLPSGLQVYYNPYSGMRLVPPECADAGLPRRMVSRHVRNSCCEGPAHLPCCWKACKRYGFAVVSGCSTGCTHCRRTKPLLSGCSSGCTHCTRANARSFWMRYGLKAAHVTV